MEMMHGNALRIPTMGTARVIHRSQGWKDVACEDIVSKTDGGGTEGADTFVAANNGPVFASNGNVLVTGNACQTGDDPAVASGATNPEDYFKASPAVAGCQQCPSTDGFGSPAAPKVCTTCEVGTTSAIVDGKSQCVCDNGATDPWDSNTADDPIKDHCQSCANGGKYLGNVDNASGAGVCESACPSDKTIYTERTSTGGVTYKLCCTDSGCTTGAGDCYDGTDGRYCKRKKLFDQCCTCIAPSSSALLRIRGDALFIFITKKSRVASLHSNICIIHVLEMEELEMEE
eukprot:scaffold15083_cov222-Skeletonema_menzelii.AAC.1